MAQVSWRADDELVIRVKRAADASGRSMNEYMSVVLDAATDPSLAGSEAERVRERLALAGLLAPPRSGRRGRPSRAAVEAAGRRAAHGVPVADLVGDGH